MKFISLILAFLFTISPQVAYCATIVTTSASKAAFDTAYSAASAGDTIIVTNTGSPATWTSGATIAKSNLNVFASPGTEIRKSSGVVAFLVQSNNVHISGFYFNGEENNHDSPFIRFGSTTGCPTLRVANGLCSSNLFYGFGDEGGDYTGQHALRYEGFAFGVTWSNTFWRCPGETIDVSGDGVAGLGRSYEFGDYSSGVVFIENNLIIADTPVRYENLVDGNSGQRFVGRYNRFEISNGAIYNSALFSTHETCALSTGVAACGDCGTLLSEVYENTVSLGTSGNMRDWVAVRGGKNLTYNNRVTYSGNFTRNGRGAYDVGMWISNYRSTSTYGDGTVCLTSTHPRGFSEYAHINDPGYTTEGLTDNMTTLAEDLDASETTITLTSTDGMNTSGNANGYAIWIGSEVIHYTSISGNDLTGCTRGASGTTASTHSNGANVDYLIFGRCLEQVNNVWIWGNMVNGVVGADMNDVFVCGDFNDCLRAPGAIDFTEDDIKSYAERPAHWQYRADGTELDYTPYTYPHDLTGLSGGGGGEEGTSIMRSKATNFKVNLK